MLLESRREAIIGLATEGDRLGYDGFFMPEAWTYDMTVLLAEAAARTTRIMLGTGILGIWNRSAATVAMAAATLHAISGGRFVLGLGASTPQLAEGLHEPPVPRMRRMHHDMPYWPLTGWQICTIWLALDPVTKESG